MWLNDKCICIMVHVVVHYGMPETELRGISDVSIT